MKVIATRTRTFISCVIAISALALILALPLFGCSNDANSEKVTIDGKEMSFKELEDAIEGNQPAMCSEYIGKEISATGKVAEVHGPDSVLYGDQESPIISHQCDKGYVQIGDREMRIIVELTDESAEIASTLKKGDEVSVSGVVSGLNRNGGISYAHILSYSGKPNGRIESSASK